MLSRLFIAALWSPDLLALVCGVYCGFVAFPFGVLGQVRYLIVSILDPCSLSYFDKNNSVSNSYAMACQPVCRVILRTGGQTCCTYFIPATSV